MGELSWMNATGDTKLIWSPGNADEVESARRTFTELKGKGFTAFKVNAKGDQGEQIRDFDPSIEKIIMVPRMAGGQ